MALCLASLAACAKEPASIRVKPPRTAPEARKGDAKLPVFVRKGETIALRASAFDKDGAFMGPAEVAWSSTDPEIAHVSAQGIVTILSTGTASIAARTTQTRAALQHSLPIAVEIIGSVEIVPEKPGPKEYTLHMGEERRYRAVVKDDRGRVLPSAKVAWRTSDYAATVDGNGLAEGRALGDTQLIATSGPKEARATLIVLDWKK